MSFSALVIVGDKKGSVGIGFGKAKEVPSAVEKAIKEAKRRMVKISLAGSTIPHQVNARFRASKILLLPASAGTGVIAGASVRAVLECVGIHDILTKNFGNTNPINVAKATLEGLKTLRSKKTVESLRGVTLA